jgi:MSHA biogenesis protein MshG
MVIGAIVIAMFFLNIKVIPKFATMFEAVEMELPLMTRVLIGTSEFFVAYWYLILFGIVTAVWGFRTYVKTPSGLLWWDKSKLSLPLVGKIIHWATVARFARALHITSTAGVPVASALPVVASAVDNAWVESKVRGMQQRIEQGSSITEAAMISNLFPPLVIQMLRIGEETGELDRLIAEVAEYYEREVDYNVKNLSSVIEPILIVVIGLMVLVLALGIFTPMWDMVKLAKQ